MKAKAEAERQLEALIAQKSSSPPRDDQELYEWIRDVFGFKIATRATHPEHQAPFDFIADAYFERYPTLLAQGPRGGGKTRGFSILETISMVHKPGIEIVAIAGSEDQVRAGYAYVSGRRDSHGEDGLIYNENIKHLISGDPSMARTVLTNGSKLEIRTGGSEKAVSGPHPQLLIIDELDHLDPVPFNTALQMPQSTSQYDSVTVMASSQYHSSGLLQNLIDNSEDKGISLYRFDIFDVMENCGRTYPTQCQTCPLFEWNNPYTLVREELCKGRGSIGEGHYKYRDVVAKFSTINAESFALQSLLMNGSNQGMVYSQYGDHNRQKFNPRDFDLTKWNAFAGVDMRGRGRIVVVLESPNYADNGRPIRWCVAEWEDDSSTPSKIINASKRMKMKVMQDFGMIVAGFWGERSGADLLRGFPRELNARPIPKEMTNVMYGIGQLRDAFLDNNGISSLFVDPDRCSGLDDALTNRYRCKRTPDGGFDRDKPDKNGDDFADCLRYGYLGGTLIPAHLPDAQPGHDFRDSAGPSNLPAAEMKYSGNKWNPYT
jgi:hypothetical protein